ncbi:MAG: triacylglycerol lipase [Lachnospiraceae bacterium]|nr:triacylglycerol lipase [Lachnospiraceae bacterium]
MRSRLKYGIRFLYAVILFTTANLYSIIQLYHMPVFGIGLFFLFFFAINLYPSFNDKRFLTKKLQRCARGCECLKLFLLSTILSVVYSILGWMGMLAFPSFSEATHIWLLNSLFVFLAEAFVFWNGMIRIYLHSSQLGVRWRVIGALCGMIPIVHLFVLVKLIRIAWAEVEFENNRMIRNNERRSDAVCRTKYPILLVHGVFFRDYRFFQYWGRIPEELEENGATIYYGNQPSAASVEECASYLDKRIRQIISETHCGKVNIIAHSKGGLDCRYALAALGTDKFVASLTTINTPHRGCEFADYLLTKISESQKNLIAATYNRTLQKIGDPNPDFLEAVTALTHHACKKRNEVIEDSPSVYYQSIGSRLNVASSGRFPLNMTYHAVRLFDGSNDGLVGEQSFPWGESYRFIQSSAKRGISHADVIDMNRENFDGFDVREFYVELVQGLKERGF